MIKKIPKITISKLQLIILCITIFLFQNIHFFKFTYNLLNANNNTVFIKIASIIIITHITLYTLLLWSFSFNKVILKVSAIIFITLNAIFMYFISTYNIYIDTAMMQNVFNTDVKETMDLLNFTLLYNVITYGILPAYLIIKFTIKDQNFFTYIKRSFILIIILLVLNIITVFGFYKEISTFIRNNKKIFDKSIPYSYIASTVKVIKAKYKSNISIVYENIQLQHKNNHSPRVMVMVIGETARKKNFSLYGYNKNTNPLLGNMKNEISVMKDTISCGTNTNVSVPCIFNPKGSVHFNRDHITMLNYIEYLKELKTLDIFWIDNNFGGCYEICKSVKTFYTQDSKDKEYCQDGQCTDGIIIQHIDHLLQNIQKDTLIIVHQNGSHGPLYYKRYDKEFDKFQPSCKTNLPQECSQEELVNAYDNTILYTDYILHTIIAKLKHIKYDSAMIYASDHGESLGENGLYLHGFPYSIAPKEQKEIPFIV